MIPCNHCGAENPLGTMFCRSCGGRIEVDPNQIMASVQQSKSEDLADRITRSGRNALAMAAFCLVAALIVRLVIVPDLPPARMPLADARSGGVLLPMVASDTPMPRADLLLGGGEESLVDWRTGNADHLLGSFGIDLENLRAWQHQIIEYQQEDGSFAGSDRVVATALAVLALQAYPGDLAVDHAARRGAQWLQIRSDRILDANDRLAQTLTAMALMERGTLDHQTIGRMANMLGSGDHVPWQAQLLPIFVPERRPQDLVVFRRALEDTPLWRHFLDRVSEEPLVATPSRELFTAETVADLAPLEQWAWSQTAWYHAAEVDVLSNRLRHWSKQPPPPLEGDLEAVAGPAGGLALRVLTCAAPARIPLTHTVSR